MAGLISDETLELVDKISVISLAERLGYRMKRAGTWLQIECPNCGDSKCYIGNRKGYFVCYDGGGCGAKGYIKDFFAWHTYHEEFNAKKHLRNTVLTIAEIMGVVVKFQDGSTKLPDPNVKAFNPADIPEYIPVEPQPVEVCDRTYRRFLSLCPIYEDHLNEWKTKRKYTDKQIKIYNLRSFPRTAAEAQKIIQTLLSEGYTLERVPGFTQILKYGTDPENDANWIWGFVAHQSYRYFLPVRDDQGYIARLRVATTNPKKKYMWFSSDPLVTENSARRNGAPSGAPINVVVPERFLSIWEPGVELTDFYSFDMVVVTEGEHKSNISANIIGKYPVIGIPGVGNFKDVLRTLIKWGCKKVAIAFDMDSFLKEATEGNSGVGKNEKVFVQLVKFSKELLSASGIEVVLWAWNTTDGKGLDDILLAHKAPIEIDLRTSKRTCLVIS
ncbi:toprim domain-containing protein [Paenibacillus sp. FSL L8-0709]|uniref:toprim domain-containing protein n=1 Tax=Paenibacillus sp. FSL L8-0709 TaxID=2975312 RepID=UPI0030FBEE38